GSTKPLDELGICDLRCGCAQAHQRRVAVKAENQDRRNQDISFSRRILSARFRDDLVGASGCLRRAVCLPCRAMRISMLLKLRAPLAPAKCRPGTLPPSCLLQAYSRLTPRVRM